ncbi:hypothetical protein EI555_016628, partial [Monodon monoceros]
TTQPPITGATHGARAAAAVAGRSPAELPGRGCRCDRPSRPRRARAVPGQDMRNEWWKSKNKVVGNPDDDQPGKCAKQPFLLLAIKSLTSHFDRRQVIWESWGKETNVGNQTVVRVFLLGQTPAGDNHPDLSVELKFESEKHQDILMWNYRDTLFNLSLKEVLLLRWVSTSCPNAEFKGDDDVFVNTRHILNHLNSLSKNKAKDLFIGDVIPSAAPRQDKKLKYYVPEVLYTGVYPPYAGGGGFLYSSHLALRLVQPPGSEASVTGQVLLYPIDAVYTGMCLQKLGLIPEKHKGFRTFDIEEKNRNNICSYVGLMLVHSRKPQEMIDIWSRLQNAYLSC